MELVFHSGLHWKPAEVKSSQKCRWRPMISTSKRIILHYPLRASVSSHEPNMGQNVVLLWTRWTSSWHADIDFLPEDTWSRLYLCSTLPGSQQMCRGAAVRKLATAFFHDSWQSSNEHEALNGRNGNRFDLRKNLIRSILLYQEVLKNKSAKHWLTITATCTPWLWYSQSCLRAGVWLPDLLNSLSLLL